MSSLALPSAHDPLSRHHAGSRWQGLGLASALTEAGERLHHAPDLESLFAVTADEALPFLPAGAVGLFEYGQQAWFLLTSSHGGPAGDARTAVPARLSLAAAGPSTSTVEAPAGSPWPSLVIGRRIGWSTRRPLRLVWFVRSTVPLSADEEAADLFSRQVDLALAAARDRDSLRQAVAARHRVGVAQGILMTRHRLTAEQAFATMRRCSQQGNVKLRQVAECVIATGQLPAQPTTDNTNRKAS